MTATARPLSGLVSDAPNFDAPNRYRMARATVLTEKGREYLRSASLRWQPQPLDVDPSMIAVDVSGLDERARRAAELECGSVVVLHKALDLIAVEIREKQRAVGVRAESIDGYRDLQRDAAYLRLLDDLHSLGKARARITDALLVVRSLAAEAPRDRRTRHG